MPPSLRVRDYRLIRRPAHPALDIRAAGVSGLVRIGEKEITGEDEAEIDASHPIFGYSDGDGRPKKSNVSSPRVTPTCLLASAAGALSLECVPTTITAFPSIVWVGRFQTGACHRRTRPRPEGDAE